MMRWVARCHDRHLGRWVVAKALCTALRLGLRVEGRGDRTGGRWVVLGVVGLDGSLGRPSGAVVGV